MWNYGYLLGTLPFPLNGAHGEQLVALADRTIKLFFSKRKKKRILENLPSKIVSQHFRSVELLSDGTSHIVYCKGPHIRKYSLPQRASSFPVMDACKMDPETESSPCRQAPTVRHSHSPGQGSALACHQPLRNNP